MNLAHEAVMNLAHEVGEVEVRSTEGEGDRVGTYLFRTDPITLTLDATRLDLSCTRE